MAAGYSSYAFWWFTGYHVGGAGPEPVLCPCPEYGHDATLADTFTNELTLTNAFTNEATLVDVFSNESSLSDQFTNDVTLVSAWKRGTCNG
jgi:hypothetical protein